MSDTEPTITIPAAIARDFIHNFDVYTANAITDHLTCREVKALAAMMTALGRPYEATMWTRSHANAHKLGNAPC